jgi:hypothetical protein
MDFDPDKYLSEKSSFDPDAYLKDKAPKASPYSALQSALMGGINQFNAVPAIGGAIQHPIAAAEGAANPILRLLGAKEFTPEDTAPYDQSRDALQKEFKQAEGDNWKSYLGGNVAGGAALSTLLPGAAAGEVAEGANAIKNAMKVGALYGAGNGAGEALSEGKDIGGIAAQTAIGGGIGGLVGGLVGKAGQMIKPDALESSAARNTIESLMPTKGQAKTLMSAPVSEDVLDAAGNVIYKAPQGESYLEQAGNVLRPYLSAFSNPEEREKARQAIADASGKLVGDAKQAVSDAGGTFTKGGDVLNFIQDLKKKFLVPGKDYSFENKVDEAKFLDRLNNDLTTIVGNGDKVVPFDEANRALDYLGGLAYNSDGTLKTTDSAQLASKVRGFMNKLVEDDVANQVQPDQLNDFMKAKELFRAATTVKKASQGASAAEISNRDFGLLGHTSAIIGGEVGGIPGMIAGVALDKAAKTGALNLGMASAQKTLANIERGTANAASHMSKSISVLTPDTLKDIGTKLMTSDNQASQQLGRVLQQMSERDGTGRNALMFTILQNPVYRDLLSGVTDFK